MKEKNKIASSLIGMIGVLSLLLIVVGTSFAFFVYNGKGTTENTVTAGTITFSYSDATKVGNGILIENQLPTTDSEGKALIGDGNVFNFNIVANTIAAAVNYEIVVEKLAKSDLDGSNVKIYLTDTTSTDEKEIGKTTVDGKVVTFNTLKDTTIEGKSGKTVFDEVILKGEISYKRNFRLRMWLKGDADLSDDTVANKTFSIIVNVFANAGHILKPAPTIILNGDNPYNISVGKSYIELGCIARDWNSKDLTPTITGSVDTNTVGVYTITYKVIDSLERETTKTRTVNIRSLPLIELIGDNIITIPLNKEYKELGVTAKDYDNNDLTPIITGEVDTATAGSYTLNYVVTDNLGGVSTITREVIIRELPIITLNGDSVINLKLNSSYIELGATAKDFNNTNLTVTTTGTVDTTKTGTYTITYSATDSLGGITLITREINVRIIPIITLEGSNPLNITKGTIYVETGYIAKDWNNANLVATINGTVDTATVGTYTITYTVTDSLGGTSSVTRTINVKSTPTIVLNGNQNIDVSINKTYIELGAVAKDYNNSNLTPVITGMVNTAVAGSYTINYTTTDSLGGTSSATRTVNVRNVPTITLNGTNPINLSFGKTYTELSAVSKDWNSIVLTTNVSGTVDTTLVGIYTITYTTTDNLGGIASITRTINVRALPIILLNGASTIDLSLGKTYTEVNATGKDWNNTALTPTISGNVNINSAGTYTLTYNVVDSLGGIASVNRTVNVRALPTIILNGDNPMEIAQGVTYIEAGYVSKDWNNTPLTAIISGLVNTNVNGINTLTYTTTDSLDGTTAAIRTVNVTGVMLKDAILAGIGTTGSTYKAGDGSNYIRGNSSAVNNYIWYSGMMWRVYRINPDGSVKVIMDDAATSTIFHANYNLYSTSYLKEWLNAYFWDHLNTSKTALLKTDNEFCIDNTNSATSAREACANKLLNEKIGLISLDEYNIVKSGNINNYLNNGLQNWTITPHTTDTTREWCIMADVGDYRSIITGFGVRPVLTFKNATAIKSGDGSWKTPYKISGDVALPTSGEKLNTRHTGEIITYDNKLWRIIEVANNLTKVAYDGKTQLIANHDFNTNNLNWTTTNAKLEAIGINTSKIALNLTWQRGYLKDADNVLTTSLADGNPVTSTFGLPRIGEMWASQNNTKTPDYEKYTNQNFWTMTPSGTSSSKEWNIRYGGYSFNGMSGGGGVRTAFHFKEEITIALGSGTPTDPYTLN